MRVSASSPPAAPAPSPRAESGASGAAKRQHIDSAEELLQQSAHRQDSLTRVPLDSCQMMATYLPVKELARLKMTSSRMNTLKYSLAM